MKPATIAEAAGQAAFINREARTYQAACKMARLQYSTAFLRDCFVMGWNRAQWATEFPSYAEATQKHRAYLAKVQL